MMIGKIKLKGEVILAPVADYTNIAFRELCSEYGAALVYTELISAKSIVMKNKKTKKMLFTGGEKGPVFLQLFGNESKDFEKAIRLVEKELPQNFSGYDLNCGCSVPKAIKGKYGASLMDSPKDVSLIIQAMKSSTEKPITIKMRLGLKEENFLEVAKVAEEAGVDAITLHPRRGDQDYSYNADWEKIRLLKESVLVPVIGNGDIKKPQDILRMKNETKCDFEMVGRIAMGNAFFFKQANNYLKTGIVIQKEINDYFEEGKKFLDLSKRNKLGVNDVRPYFIALSKGLDGATTLRNNFALSKTIEEIEKHFSDYFLNKLNQTK